MKDSSVAPLGLFDPCRQRCVLDGLDRRFRSCAEQQQQLQRSHAEQRAEEERRFASRRAQATEVCRQQRRAMLTQWDQAEEKLISDYEAAVVNAQDELRRVASIFRRRQAEGETAIFRKVEARRQAVLQQYENHQNQPNLEKRRQIQRIKEALSPIIELRESARDLAISRLDSLPSGSPTQDWLSRQQIEKPASITEALEAIDRLTLRCQETLDEMHTGLASKLVDSFYLPAAVVTAATAWALGVFLFGPQPPWLSMAVGVSVVAVLGFVAYLYLLWPLKKTMSRLYPRLEQLAHLAETHANVARQIVNDAAQRASQQLAVRRDEHWQTTTHWQAKQLSELETSLAAEASRETARLETKLAQIHHDFAEQFEATHRTMFERANALAEQISKHLSQIDLSLQQEREVLTAQQCAECESLESRLKRGWQNALDRIQAANQSVTCRFPAWSQVAMQSSPVMRAVDFLPLGTIPVGAFLRAAAESMPSWNWDLTDSIVPPTMPVVLHRRRHSAVVITAPTRQLPQAVELIHQVLWRLLTAVTASRCKLTLIDPLGRGQHFTGLMAIADRGPALVGHRVWTAEKNIEERLGDLARHLENVLQSRLRDRYHRIEDYNEIAGSLAEPYHAVAAVGFPAGLTREGYRYLQTLIENGSRCGVFTLLACDAAKPWPPDLPVPGGDIALHLNIDDKGKWNMQHPGLEKLGFQPAPAPPAPMRDEFAKRLGNTVLGR